MGFEKASEQGMWNDEVKKRCSMLNPQLKDHMDI